MSFIDTTSFQVAGLSTAREVAETMTAGFAKAIDMDADDVFTARRLRQSDNLPTTKLFASLRDAEAAASGKRKARLFH